MNRAKTILSICSLIIFLLMVKRFYTEALVYEPLTEFQVHTFLTDTKTRLKPESAHREQRAAIQDITLTKLFRMERPVLPPRPLTAIAPPPPPAPEPPPQMVLKGIILEPDGKYRAYIEIDGKRLISLRLGEGVDNITLTEIKERSVSLKWKEQTVELSIDQKRR